MPQDPQSIQEFKKQAELDMIFAGKSSGGKQKKTKKKIEAPGLGLLELAGAPAVGGATKLIRLFRGLRTKNPKLTLKNVKLSKQATQEGDIPEAIQSFMGKDKIRRVIGGYDPKGGFYSKNTLFTSLNPRTAERYARLGRGSGELDDLSRMMIFEMEKSALVNMLKNNPKMFEKVFGGTPFKTFSPELRRISEVPFKEGIPEKFLKDIVSTTTKSGKKRFPKGLEKEIESGFKNIDSIVEDLLNSFTKGRQAEAARLRFK